MRCCFLNYSFTSISISISFSISFSISIYGHFAILNYGICHLFGLLRGFVPSGFRTLFSGNAALFYDFSVMCFIIVVVLFKKTEHSFFHRVVKFRSDTFKCIIVKLAKNSSVLLV